MSLRPSPMPRPLARGPRRLLLAVALATVAMPVVGARPAAAHGQEVLISLEATADDAGAAEVTAAVTFRGDGHPASGVPLETTATSGSEQVGIELTESGEPGTYTGTAELTPGSWEITTTATGDFTGTAVTDLTVPEPAPTTTEPPPTTAPDPETTQGSEAPEAADPAEPASAGAGSSPLLVVIPVALVVLGVAVLLWRRLRRA